MVNERSREEELGGGFADERRVFLVDGLLVVRARGLLHGRGSSQDRSRGFPGGGGEHGREQCRGEGEGGGREERERLHLRPSLYRERGTSDAG